VDQVAVVMDSPFLLISSDCHAGAPPDVYATYLDADVRDTYEDWLAAQEPTAPPATSDSGKDTITTQIAGLSLDPFGQGIRERFYASAPVIRGAVSGSWDGSIRDAELDAAGVAGEVVFPDSQHRNGVPFRDVRRHSNVESYALRRAGAVAHNRWMADLIARSPERHAGVAIVELDDIGTAVADLTDAREMGLFGGLLLPPLPLTTDDPEMFWHHPKYEKLWDACEDLDLPVNVHVAAGGAAYGESPATRWINSTEIFWVTRRPVWIFLWTGIFERHPGLRLVVTEAGGYWVPEMLETMDYLYDNRNPEAAREALPLRPREYWHRQCYVGASPPAGRAELEALSQIGTRNLLWGNDYPHVEGTWSTDSRQAVIDLVSGLDHADARAFLGLNALDVYRFDAVALDGIARQLEFSPAAPLIR
jgi:predicted TIM-barrel fold metal-dependent hydrolase